MSLHVITLRRLSIGWVSKELRTESFISDETDRIASQVEEEEGGAEEAHGECREEGGFGAQSGTRGRKVGRG